MNAMKATILALASAMIAVAGAAPRAQEPAPDQSLNRMKSVLEKPPLRLTLPESQATFKVEIKAIHPMHEIFDTVPWATDPVGWQPPGVGLDLAFVFRYMASVKDVSRLAREICGDCVPREFARPLRTWMDQIQRMAREVEQI